MKSPERDIESYAARYSRYRNGRRSFEKILETVRRENLVSLLNRSLPKEILEIGSGPNPICKYYGSYTGYTAVEPHPDFAEAVRQLKPSNKNVEVIEGLFEELDTSVMETRNFDAVIMSSVLHEVGDPVRFLESVRRLCTSDTFVYINVPNMYSFHRLLALEMELISDLFQKSERGAALQQQTQFDKQRLTLLLRETGFDVLRAGTYLIKPFTHDQMEQILEARIIEPAVLDGLKRMTRYLPDMGCELFVEAKIQ